MAPTKFTVSQIKDLLSSGLTTDKRIEIKQGGRPTPALNIVQVTKSKNRDFKREFKPDVYDKNTWICGCEISNRLFCFPCLLFSEYYKNYPGGEMTWIDYGVSDLSHLPNKMKKHESTQSHLNSVLEHSILGKIDIRQQLDSNYRQNTKVHNEEVTKNRYALSKIIDCINFGAIFELRSGGGEGLSNADVFRGLINFSAELDMLLKDHLSKAKIFKGTSKEIISDLLDCMLSTCQENIKKEISNASFVSVIADEIGDISSNFQFSIVLRYVLPNGDPVERFWELVNPLEQDAESIAKCIRDALDSVVSSLEQVISQSYNGTTVHRVKDIVKQNFENAHFVHCYGHYLRLIVAQSTSRNPQIKVFFSNLNGIAAFFNNSQERVAVLDNVVGKRPSQSFAKRWNFNEQGVNFLFMYRMQLIQCMEQLEQSSRQWTTVNQAGAFRRILKDSTFIFWLAVFNNIMPHVDTLHNQLQRKTTDPVQTKMYIDSFEVAIAREKENMDKIRMEIEAELLQTNSLKRPRDDVGLSRTLAAKEVCDVIVNQIRSRFCVIPYYSAVALFKTQQFPEYEKLFPSELLMNTVEVYACLEKNQLRTELEIIYRRVEFRNVYGAIIFIKFIIENNLQTTFSQTYKLLQIILTIPMTTVEAERCFSTLTRIKTFLTNTISNSSALAMLSVERDMVKNMPNFNEKVIDLFASKKDWGMNFVYETCN